MATRDVALGSAALRSTATSDNNNFGPFCPILGPFWAISGHFGPPKGPETGQKGPKKALFGHFLAIFWSIFELFPQRLYFTLIVSP